MARRAEQKKRPGRGGRRVHGHLQGDAAGAFAEVHALVRQIPRGRVMTYGQIARLLTHRLSPAAVGWALHRCPRGVPWQRVVNAAGGCSTDRLGAFPPGFQRALLEREGVRFRPDDTLELERYRWCPQEPPGA